MSIWKYQSIKNKLSEYLEKDLDKADLLTLDEGETPIEIIKLSNNNNLILKREDKNPTGSWKDRGTAFKINYLKEKGIREVVLPSSGNAAISFLNYANKIENLVVHVVVSPNANQKKIEKIKSLLNNKHKLHISKMAKREASRISINNKALLLRSSMDSQILAGYWSLGFELAKFITHNQQSQNILISSASSGTTMVGMIEGLMQKLDDEYKIPKVFVVQTESCFPIPKEFNNYEGEAKEKSLADSIVDQSVLRMPQILNILKNTDGEVNVVTNQELEQAENWVNEELKMKLSYTSLLPIATFLKMQEDYTNTNFICVTSGF